MHIPRSIKVRWRYLLRYVVRARASSHEIAWGFAIGLAVAWTPTFGLQMIIAGVLATLFKGSRIPALAATWVSNVFTVAPMYTTAWRLGYWVLSGFESAGSERRAARLRHTFQTLATMEADEPFWAQMYYKMLAAMEFGTELWLGCILCGLATALAAYPIMLRLVEGQRQVAARRRAKRLHHREGRAKQLKLW